MVAAIRRRPAYVLLLLVVSSLIAATYSSRVRAQEPQPAMRWDGVIEHVSVSTGYGWPNPTGPARISRHPVSADGRYVVFSADVPNDPYPTTPHIFKRDRLTGETQPIFGGDVSDPPVISADGRFVAFRWCNSWWRGDGAPFCDVYVIDLVYWTFINASTAVDGTLSDADSAEPMISRDGRFVAFQTNATTLVPAPAPPGQIVLRDRDADGDGIFDEPDPGTVTIEKISISSAGEPGDAPSSSVEVSADGRIVAFQSQSSNLVAGDANGGNDAFFHDRQSGETRRVSVTPLTGHEAVYGTDWRGVSMSEDGSLIAFAANDPLLSSSPAGGGGDDINNSNDVYVYDRMASTLQRIDPGPNGQLADRGAWSPSLSADGRYFSFLSWSTNLGGPVDPQMSRVQVYAHDRVTGTTQRITLKMNGGEPIASTDYASISGDGSFIVFLNLGFDMAPTATPGIDSVFGAGHFSIEPAEFTVASGGGQVTATINAQAYVKWNPDYNDYSPWVQWTTPPWGPGSGSLTFSAERNPDPVSREQVFHFNSRTITIRQEPGLSFTSFSPTSGSGGTVVTLTGTGFESTSRVWVELETGFEPQPFEFVGSTEIRLTMPARGFGDAHIAICTADSSGCAMSTGTFHYPDTTPPQIFWWADHDPAETGWYRDDVTFSFGVWDPETSVTSMSGCGTTLLSTDTTGTTFTCTATSEGGTATLTSPVMRRDARPPFVSISRPERTLYHLNQTVNAYWNCSDAGPGSGIESCVASTPHATPFDTSTSGFHTFDVMGTDRAGNRASASRTYAVSSGMCTVRPQGLLAWWPGDYDYRDVIGGHDAGLVPPGYFGEFAAGISRGAMSISNKYVQVGDTPALEMQSAMTLSAWVFNSTSSPIGVIAGREGEYLLGIGNDSRVRYSMANGDPGWGWINTDVTVDYQVYTHLVLTYDGSLIKLYKNGQLAYVRVAGGDIGDAAPGMNDFRIGNRQDTSGGSAQYNGLIDNVEVVGRALAADEIERAFLSADAGYCPDPSTLEFVPSPQHTTYGQSTLWLTAALKRGGVPEPNTWVTFKYQGTQIASGFTDAAGVATAQASMPAGLIATTYVNALRAEVPANAVITAASVVSDLVVDKATPVITWATPASIGYGTALGSQQLNATANVAGSFTYTPGYGTVPGAGSQTLSTTFTPSSSNYRSATASVVLQVSKATPTITVTGGIFTYDAAVHSATASVRGVGGVNLGPVAFTYNGSSSVPVAAGTYSVVASYAGDANYNAVSGTATVTIEKATPTVTVTAGTFAYDGAAHAAATTVTGAGGANLGPVTLTYNGVEDLPVNAGSYAVVANYAGDANYSAASGSGTLTIAKATPTVSVNAGTFTYDGASHGATATVTGVGGTSLGPIAFTYNGAEAAPLDAGTYAVVASYSGDANYNAASGTATLTIGKATPTVSASGGTFTYDGAPHVATATVTGVGEEVLGPATFTYNGSADVPVNAGTYDVAASYAGSANYEAASGTATLTIGKATPTVTASGGSFTYDGAVHPAAGAATGVGGASLSPVTFTYNGGTGAPINAGSYAVVATFAGDANYEAASGTATLTIGKATATVTVNGGSFTYNGASHPATGTVTGIGGATLGPLTFTYNGASEAPVNAGQYAVVGTFAGDTNYESATGNATITITRAAAVLNWATPASIVYGTPLGAAQLNATADTDGTFTYSPAAGTVLPAGAGQVITVTFTPNSANYSGGSSTVTLGISPAPLTIRANDATKRFGAELPVYSATGIGFVNGDSLASLNGTLEFAVPATPASPVGTYPITPNGVSSPNYTIAFANGTLNIVKGAVGVAVSTSPEPSGYNQPMTFTATVSAAAPAVGNPGGTVSFYDGSVLLGASTIGSGGAASLTTAGLPAGTRAIEARYGGDGSFETGTGSAPHVIRDATDTPSITVTSTRNPAPAGQIITLSANINVPSGTMQFYDGATLLGQAPITSGRATWTTASLPAGSHAITALYVGNGTTPPVISPVFVQATYLSSWKNRVTTTALSASPNPAALGTTVVFNITVTGSTVKPTGRVLVMVNGSVVGDPAGIPLAPGAGATGVAAFSLPGLAHGNHTVTATYLGDPTYKGSTSSLTEGIN